MLDGKILRLFLFLMIFGIIKPQFIYPQDQDSLTVKTFTVEEHTGDCEDSKSTNCAHIKLEYFRVEIPSNIEAQKKINSFMQQRMLESFVGNENPDNIDDLIKEYLDEYKKFKRDFPDSWQQWEVERSAEVIFLTDKILAAKILEYTYLGGAHPNSSVTYYNFNLQTGNLINLPELFKEGYEKELNKIAEQIFREEKGLTENEDLNKAGYWFGNNEFKVNNNFSLNSEGILFRFNSYEIAPYAMGPTSVFIPYNEIKQIINKQSIVSKFIRE